MSHSLHSAHAGAATEPPTLKACYDTLSPATAGVRTPRCKHAPCGHSRASTATGALSGGTAAGSTTSSRAEP